MRKEVAKLATLIIKKCKFNATESATLTHLLSSEPLSLKEFKGGSFAGRWSENLRCLLFLLDAKEVLREKWINDYQGFVDVDVLLSNGMVFSYEYSYGSCSVCDAWESRYPPEVENVCIMTEMMDECSLFDSEEHYREWRRKINKNKLH